MYHDILIHTSLLFHTNHDLNRTNFKMINKNDAKAISKSILLF